MQLATSLSFIQQEKISCLINNESFSILPMKIIKCIDTLNNDGIWTLVEVHLLAECCTYFLLNIYTQYLDGRLSCLTTNGLVQATHQTQPLGVPEDR